MVGLSDALAAVAMSHTLLNSSSQQSFCPQVALLTTIFKLVIKSVFCLCISLFGGSSRARSVELTWPRMRNWNRSSGAAGPQPSLCTIGQHRVGLSQRRCYVIEGFLNEWHRGKMPHPSLFQKAFKMRTLIVHSNCGLLAELVKSITLMKKSLQWQRWVHLLFLQLVELEEAVPCNLF